MLEPFGLQLIPVPINSDMRGRYIVWTPYHFTAAIVTEHNVTTFDNGRVKETTFKCKVDMHLRSRILMTFMLLEFRRCSWCRMYLCLLIVWVMTCTCVFEFRFLLLRRRFGYVFLPVRL
jgi:hypothetical protein